MPPREAFPPRLEVNSRSPVRLMRTEATAVPFRHIFCFIFALDLSQYVALKGGHDEAICVEGTAFRGLDPRHGLGLSARTEGRQYQPRDRGGAGAARLRCPR